MWFDLPCPMIIGHRGDSAHAPENTLSAFQAALLAGADAIEFDVKLTSDGRVVIIHDQSLERTTNGTGRVVEKSLGELRSLEAGAHFPGRHPGERIPTLDEVFDQFGRQLFMNIELTNYLTPQDGLVAAVIELVRRFKMEDRILFSSFLPWNLSIARRALPNIPCGLLTMRGWMGAWGRKIGWRAKTYAALHPFYTDVDEGMVERVHAAGKRFNVWTVNAEEDLRRMIGYGVDGLITDDPALAGRLTHRGDGPQT